MSTCIWVYAEPILSLHLTENLKVQDWATPLYFGVFSLGYLAAASTIFCSDIKSWDPSILSPVSFMITGVLHLLLVASFENENVTLITSALGLFLMSFFSTFTLVPIYSKMIRSLDEHFDFELVSRQEVIDKSSSLSVFFKSLAQISAPIYATQMYSSAGYQMLFSLTGGICVVYGIILYFALRQSTIKDH